MDTFTQFIQVFICTTGCCLINAWRRRVQKKCMVQPLTVQRMDLEWKNGIRDVTHVSEELLWSSECGGSGCHHLGSPSVGGSEVG